MKLEQRLANIEMILSDVDGVLTDGGIYYDNQGIESKKFNIKDGLGIKLWQRAGYQFGILTARSSNIVKIRSEELGLSIVRQGFDKKLPAAQQIAEEQGLSLAQVCYIGDDLTDLPVIENVALGVAVADAVEEVRSAAHYVTKRCGGQGAVRELIERLLKEKMQWDDLTRHYHH